MAALWAPGVAVRLLGTLGGCGSSAWAVNRWGEAVGASSFPEGGCDDRDPNHAYIQPRSSTALDLGTLGGARSEAVAINGRGQVAGWSHTASGNRQAFFWSPATKLVPLGTLGGAWSKAAAINDLGQIVGTSATTLGYTHGFFWSLRTGMVDIGSGEPSAINGLGHVVGTVSTGSGPAAYFWSELGGRTTLRVRRARARHQRPRPGGRRPHAAAREAVGHVVAGRSTVGELLDWHESQIAVLRYGGTVTASELADDSLWVGKARESLASGNSPRLATYLDKLNTSMGTP